MTCSNCEPWAAKTRKALNNRLRNTLINPYPKPFECPNCGGTDWMLTDALVELPKHTGLMHYQWCRNIYAELVSCVLRRQYRGFEKVWEEEGVDAAEIVRTRAAIDELINDTIKEIKL